MGIFKIKSKIFILAILGLVGGVFGFYQCFIFNAFAEETQFNISLEPAIEMIIPASVELPIIPDPSGTIESTSFNILVGTNNITGYTLTMTNSSTELINSTASATIPTLEDDTTKSNFPTNRWGYSLDDITYNPIITSDTILKTTNTYGNADTTTINLATKIDLTTPAGTYSNTFVFTVVVNPIIYTITWDSNGGSPATYSDNITKDSQIADIRNTLPEPTQDGYDLIGWYTDPADGIQITTETIVTNDITYYAHWEKAKAIIDFIIEDMDTLRPHLSYQFQAKEGMTWSDFVDSQYNTMEMVVVETGSLCSMSQLPCINMGSQQGRRIKLNDMSTTVRPNNVIVPNYIYMVGGIDR